MDEDGKHQEREFVKILHADGLCNSQYEEPVPAAKQTVETVGCIRRYVGELEAKCRKMLRQLREAGL